MKFSPHTILFSLTNKCNLSCGHCTVKKDKKTISKTAAIRFLRECREKGINTVGFTGGEPFLAIDLLCSLVKEVLRQEMFFDRIMINGVWFHKKDELKKALSKLYKIGYDGSICLSIDAFHNQNLKKVAIFIKTALSIWQRKDFISISYTAGAKDKETNLILKKLTKLLDAKFLRYSGNKACIKNDSLLIRLTKIDLSPIGQASGIKNPWKSRVWFREDYCRGPGNVLFVEPSGDVKPCCGYSVDFLDELTIGNIKTDSVDKIIKNANKNRYIQGIFDSGLSRIRCRLNKLGVKFPGKTANHCFFCYYIFKEIPRKVLNKCLPFKLV
jgi:radical SAM protein with 4Fe4S-binding SPASM domain